MIIITTDAELETASLAPHTQALLRKRRAMLDEYQLPLEEMATFVVVQPGDTLTEVSRGTGFLENWEAETPPWEWAHDHGHCFEAPIITSDDGFAVVLFVEKTGIDPALQKLLRDTIK